MSELFFGGRAEPDFERRTVEELRAGLDAAGLSAAFWELPAH